MRALSAGSIKESPPFVRYAIAVAAGFIAGWLTYSIPVLSGTPFIFCFPVVVLAAWFLGTRAAWVSALVGAMVIGRLILAPHPALDLATGLSVLHLFVFLVVSLFIASAAHLVARERSMRKTAELERELKTARAEAQLLAQQQASIEESRRQREKLEAVQRLAMSLSHEINNPLEALTNLVFLIGGCNSTADVRVYSELAEQELKRLTRVAVHSLSIFRESTPHTDIKISSLIDSVLGEFEESLCRQPIAVERDYRDDLGLRCSAGDLKQIIARLISNALNAMPSGGQLRIRVRASRDWRDHRSPGVRITIADTGHGMDLATRRQVYQPFFSTKPETRSGLGLWVVSQLVGRQQGDLRVWSTSRGAKKGTVFSLFIPANTAVGATPLEPRPQVMVESGIVHAAPGRSDPRIGDIPDPRRPFGADLSVRTRGARAG